MVTKVCLVSLGCPKNLVDSEFMLGKLDSEGFELTVAPEEADIIIVNTCGFIDSAKEEAINTIFSMAEYKRGKCTALIAAGCLAQRYSNEIVKEMPEVDFVLGTGNYKDIANVVRNLLNVSQEDLTETINYSGGPLIDETGDLSEEELKRLSRSNRRLCSLPTEVDYLNERKIISTPKTYAYLKIAEGCDNKCAYCIIPYLRGHFMSRKKEDVLKEAEDIVRLGHKEIILVAQDTTRYGIDLYGEFKLAELLKDICQIKGDFRVRIMYCYPDAITDELIDVIATNDKICKYMDIPVQHGSDRVLKEMGRRSLSKEIKEKIAKLRAAIPEIYIRTSLITGFPGETNRDYTILKDFVREMEFDRLGVFEYSKEDGTRAALMDNQIPKKVKKFRRDGIMEIQREISKNINEKRLGKEYYVIAEGVAPDNIFYYGRTYAEAPDIDGLVYFTAAGEIEIGDTVKVRILDIEEYDLIGEQLL